MGRSCHSGQYWDALLQQCFGCHTVCKHQPVISRCSSYCESAACKARPGHYFDVLLKRCVRCADVCGRHPADCSQHCQRTPPVTTKKLLVQVTSHMQNSGGISVPTALEDSTIVLYSLMALCIVLLFSSLSLAMAVLLRMARAKNSDSGPEEADHNMTNLVQPGQEVGGLGQNDFLTNSNGTTDREPSHDSSPTETCICVHCFPDMKAKDQGNDRPQRTPSSFYQQPFLHRALIQNGGPVWTEENLYIAGHEVQDTAIGQGSFAVAQNNWNGQMCS
ncbi:tumor necrosis factor receptor superfamily member 13B [Centropristis striata]|uniref:tumor necrosis factor receptor superfamily member 13B n=1 Tax=Centropristis striata TaxID=184440 RepID=UPI0027E067E6|nr:tumor necrosis factor receptor superfamily member 13B [Centropristis striata]